MSTGEIVGLALAAGAAGAAAALMAALLLSRRHDRGRHKRAADARAGWLAAHRTVTRASISFILAFRALAAERRDSVYFELRAEEAQRARAHLCDAMRELDRAAATLIVTYGLDPDSIHFFDGGGVGPDALRAAIDGSPNDVQTLVVRLRRADREALDLVRGAVTESATRDRGGRARVWLARGLAWTKSITDSWCRP